MTKYTFVVALIVIFQPSFQEVTTSSTLTSTECIPAEAKTLLECLLSADCFIASDAALKVHESKPRELVHEDGQIPVIVGS